MNNNFVTFTHEMPHGISDTFRKMIIAKCGITGACYRNWYRGATVPASRHAMINAIALQLCGKKVWEDEQ